MSDRELLELAAKAAGVVLHRWGDVWAGEPGEEGFQTDGYGRWNPLTDDGDALRLAMHLQMTLDLGHRGASVRSPGRPAIEEFCHQDSGENPECTRRAIVRAAAEIGRIMP